MYDLKSSNINCIKAIEAKEKAHNVEQLDKQDVRIIESCLPRAFTDTLYDGAHVYATTVSSLQTAYFVWLFSGTKLMLSRYSDYIGERTNLCTIMVYKVKSVIGCIGNIGNIGMFRQGPKVLVIDTVVDEVVAHDSYDSYDSPCIADKVPDDTLGFTGSKYLQDLPLISVLFKKEFDLRTVNQINGKIPFIRLAKEQVELAKLLAYNQTSQQCASPSGSSSSAFAIPYEDGTHCLFSSSSLLFADLKDDTRVFKTVCATSMLPCACACAVHL